jgi:predicted neutral ceramidase superfamily lipid hydrolase
VGETITKNWATHAVELNPELAHPEIAPETPLIVDCHNAVIGDEFLMTEGCPETAEMLAVSRGIQRALADSEEPEASFNYGVARGNFPDYTIMDGIGPGGIIVHYFEVGAQRTVLIHVDANNATPSVRAGLVSLAEDMGLDRVEFTTSDTHSVARIISRQGYYPMGVKIPAAYIVAKARQLIGEAMADAGPVEVAHHESVTPGYSFWGHIEHFDVVISTIERCLRVSKLLFTVGLLIPALLSLLLMVFYYDTQIVLP